MRQLSIITFVFSTALTSCTTYSYFQSPLHSNNTFYKAIPFHDDSIGSALYASGSVTLGGVNDKLRGGVYTFSGSIHKSHNVGIFQAYYGVSGMLGEYKIDSVYNADGTYHNESLDVEFINPNVGEKFIAAAGGFGGINVVMPIRNGEWRILGTELSWAKEFGNYVDFRNKIPDTSSNYIERRSDYFTLGICSDIIGRRDYGSVGFKLGIVYNPRTMRGFNKDGRPTVSSATYLSQTFHFETNDRFTGFAQVNTGSHSLMFIAGLNYKIR
jgi:hypothetical protein